MGYALLWVEDFVFWLCFMALGVALASRVKRRSVRWLVFVVFMSIPLLFLGGIVVLTGNLEFGPAVRTGLLIPSVCLLTLSLFGGAILARRGLHKADDERPRASHWDLRAIGLSTLAALLIHAMTFWNLDLAVRQQMDSLRVEAGALATSVAPPQVPDRENAAFLYQQAFDGGLEIKKPEHYEHWLTETTRNSSMSAMAIHTTEGRQQPTQPFDPLHDVEFITYVEQNSELCRLLREATERPSCNFARDWGRPSLGMQLQETQNMRWAARELQLEAHYQAPKSLRLAFENLVAMHRLADHVSQEPLLVSLLVSFAIDSLAVANLEVLLQQYPTNAEDLEVLDAWRPSPATPRLQRALRMEEAFGLATMCQVADWQNLDPLLKDLGVPQWPLGASSLYRVFLMSYDVGTYRSFHQSWQHASRLPVEQRKAAVERISESLKSNPGGIMSRLLLPALEAVSTAAARIDVQQRLAQLGIAAHRYRIAKGDFPESIDELVKYSKTIYARDPFNNELLKMTRRGNEVILYSVGPDLVDDGGRATPDPKTRNNDLAFVLKK